jgi:hypothetical protein
MAGQGVAPADPTTLLGQVRGLVGDTVYTALEPPVTGQGSYEYFSDLELNGFLAVSSDSVYRAAGNAVFQLAIGAALTASNIATDDLHVETEKRAADLRAIAAQYFARADADDAKGELADAYFSVTSFDSRGRKHTSSLNGVPATIPGYLRP